ncbi:MAG: amidase [Bacteroidetes bacterium]|nr:amidase [Bacteroidota bacterium]
MCEGIDIACLPATTLQKALRERKLSPVELVRACLNVYETLNPTLNAIVTLNDRVLEEARVLETKPPNSLLYGLPVGIKDTTDTHGLRTTYGSTAYRDHIPERDAEIVVRLKAAGALVLGKTNTPIFAVGGETNNAVFGSTRNPWNAKRSPGGSTGGGAVAVATGMVALADGTDLGGSLRMPASFCGIVGLRPSPGIVPQDSASFLWDRLSVAGGLGRTAEDLGLFMQAVAGPYDASPLPYPAHHPGCVLPEFEANMRLGYCEHLTALEPTPVVASTCHSAINTIESRGVSVKSVNLSLANAPRAFAVLRAHHLLTLHRDRLNQPDAAGGNLTKNLSEALNYSALDLADAERIADEVWRTFERVFQKIDFLLTPTTAVLPFKLSEGYPRRIKNTELSTYYDWFAPTSVLSLTGLPVASVPCGLSPGGLPVGMQIVGKPRQEAAVLALASLVQEWCPISLPPILQQL